MKGNTGNGVFQRLWPRTKGMAVVMSVGIISCLVVANQIVSNSNVIEDMQRQLAQLQVKAHIKLGARSAMDGGDLAGGTWNVDDEALPMSIRLGANIHWDHGQGGLWTDMVSPAPVPPPKPLTTTKKRNMYGGSMEADHVGGFLQNDTQSYEPKIWEFMTKLMGIKSVIDIGCGRGISTKWFLDHGCRVRCAEATEEGVRTSVLPSRDLITQHDYTQGPWWPQETFDAVWSVEFLEHVHEDYMDNWFATMRSAHYVFTSHSKWGGHHHVAIHHEWWWIEKFASRGFEFLPEITNITRILSRKGNYVWKTGLVFRNTRNLRVKPMYGPGTGSQDCAETKKLLWGTQLLKAACTRTLWPRNRNPLIPWVGPCKGLCERAFKEY